jgi:hypothetical protein
MRVLLLKCQYRSIVVNPGTKESVVPPSDIQIHVKGLALGAELKDNDGRSSLKLSYQSVSRPTEDDDEEDESENDDEPNAVIRQVVLGSLTPGKVNHALPSFCGDINPLASSLDRTGSCGHHFR